MPNSILNPVGQVGAGLSQMPAKTMIAVPQIGFEPRRAGSRIPAINRKLGELLKYVVWKPEVSFCHLTGDSAIEVLGNYNPLYGGIPKKLTHALLTAAANPQAYVSLRGTGLIYGIPHLVGVRKGRMRTSAAGLELLDHWAKKFPAFAPFVDAYVKPKDRRVIISDCFDLAMGALPASFKAMKDKNFLYQLKADSRSLKEKNAEIEKLRAELIRQQMIDAQKRQYYGTSIGSPPNLGNQGIGVSLSEMALNAQIANSTSQWKKI